MTTRKKKYLGVCPTCNNGVYTINGNLPKGNYCSRDCANNAVPTTWDPTVAYFMGLMASDGNLSRTGPMSFASSTPELANTFKILVESLNITPGIRTTQPKKGKLSTTIGLTDYPLRSCCIQTGLTPNKSLTLEVNLPTDEEGYNYFWLFFRGVFEGDGTIHKDTRVGTTAQVSIISGSRSFVEWLQKEMHKRGFIGTEIRPNKTAWSLQFLREHTLGLRWHMYDAWPEFAELGHPDKKALLAKRKRTVDTAYWAMKWKAQIRIISSYLYAERLLGRPPRWKEYSLIYKYYQSVYGQSNLFSPNKINTRFTGWVDLQNYVEECPPLLKTIAIRQSKEFESLNLEPIQDALGGLNFVRHKTRGFKTLASDEST